MIPRECEKCIHCRVCAYNNPKRKRHCGFYEESRQTSEWIPIKYRPLTAEERIAIAKYYGIEYCDTAEEKAFDCPMPDDGQEILISTSRGVTEDVADNAPEVEPPEWQFKFVKILYEKARPKGKWIIEKNRATICSNCGKSRRDSRKEHIYYCNHCGARMITASEVIA